MSDGDIVQDFLVESYENLDRLDRDLIELERNPQDHDALAGVFRTIHTIKGTCGFLGFSKLEKVTHAGENLLSRLRDRQLVLTPEITTALLTMVDAVRQMLKTIESSGQDGDNDYPELRENLTRLQDPAHGGTPTPTHENCTARAELPENPTPDLSPSPTEARLTESTAASQPNEARTRDASAETIRVGVNLLDRLMTMVGELVLARNQLLQFTNSLEHSGLHAASQRLNLIATELQEQVMKTRMQPIGNLWSQYPRTVRDVALGCGKQVEIEMEGKDTELDKTIIESIKDPLTHLVRNAVDHGIEAPEARIKAGKPPAGRLLLRAYHEGGQVIIEISDDGAGLDLERIRAKGIARGLLDASQAAQMSERDLSHLIFVPGLSTAEQVTNVSGRGVGMDVVKTNIERIGGIVDVQSISGKGTTIRVKIPLTLAIIPALVVRCGGERYAIPQVNLLELVRLDGGPDSKGIEMVHGAPVYRLRGQLLPLVYLKRELQSGRQPMPSLGSTQQLAEDPSVSIVVLQADDRQFGLVVDEINDSQEIVVKPLRKQLNVAKTFAGSSIMGDGRVALILDVLGLARHANAVTGDRDHLEAEKAAARNESGERQTFLLFSGPDESRMAIPLSTVARLEEFPLSEVETSGSQWLVQYRGQILPLIRLDRVLDERRRTARTKRTLPPQNCEPLQVLVLNQHGRTVGLVVERILDIVEDSALIQSPATRAATLYSAVIGKRVTELLDIAAVLKAAERDSSQSGASISKAAAGAH
ncbi:MAG TPA: chemotaxis protein CheA [Terriglobales bacterium]